MVRAAVGFVVTLLMAPVAWGQTVPSSVPGVSAVSAERAFVQTYCFGCHNPQRRTAGLDLEAADVDRAGANAVVWEKVVRYLRSGLHPPQGATPRPDKGSVTAFVASITAALDRDAASAWSAGGARRLTDAELASRLALFLWDTTPDDELAAAAAAGTLTSGGALEPQARRMLADPRARDVLARAFATPLHLDNLARIAPDRAATPNFDESLRAAMRQETRLFLEHQIREDAPVTELLSANYTFANERLARHYGVTGVQGLDFRRITFGDNRRGGLLGEGTVLAVTSFRDRTSPVVRGKWVLESFLGVTPPPPPANVPPLKPNDPGLATSVRGRLEQHRRNPVCGACHAGIDPIGFALENFDGLGQWRDAEGGAPIDPTGVLADGTPLAGPADLRAALLERGDAFAATITSTVLAHAMGRKLEYFDMPAIRGIVGDTSPADLHWSAVVLGIVRSTPFQMVRND